jgi:hypothetical protein
MAMFEGGQLDDAFGAAQRVLDSGRRFHVPDLEALGIVLQGLVLARQERIAEAVLLLDEAMAMATSGRLSVRATGLIYCRCIRTWLDIFDFRRCGVDRDGEQLRGGHRFRRQRG